ncbi:hypothetical protein C0991_010249, partial [Blastosporella zonata]
MSPWNDDFFILQRPCRHHLGLLARTHRLPPPPRRPPPPLNPAPHLQPHQPALRRPAPKTVPYRTPFTSSISTPKVAHPSSGPRPPPDTLPSAPQSPPTTQTAPIGVFAAGERHADFIPHKPKEFVPGTSFEGDGVGPYPGFEWAKGMNEEDGEFGEFKEVDLSDPGGEVEVPENVSEAQVQQELGVSTATDTADTI